MCVLAQTWEPGPPFSVHYIQCPAQQRRCEKRVSERATQEGAQNATAGAAAANEDATAKEGPKITDDSNSLSLEKAKFEQNGKELRWFMPDSLLD